MGSRNPIRMPAKMLRFGHLVDLSWQRKSLSVYSAVMAAFTSLALSASHLGTRYLNAIYVVERSQYDQLGALMITVALLGLVLPIITVLFFNTIDYQTWKRGFRYVQQKIINDCHIVFTRIGGRRMGAVCRKET